MICSLCFIFTVLLEVGIVVVGKGMGFVSAWKDFVFVGDEVIESIL